MKLHRRYVLQQSLTGQLLAYVLGGLLVVWISLIAIGHATGRHEADELTDGHLASTAFLQIEQWQRLVGQSSPRISGQAAFPQSNALPALLPALKNHDYQQSISVVVWDAAGQPMQQLGQAPWLPFGAASEGFQTLQLGSPALPWRVFSRWSRSPEGALAFKVAVLLSLQERDALAEDIADQVTGPIYWLLPVVALVLGLAIYKGLQPLYELARDVDGLDIHQCALLQHAHPHTEFATVVRSINTLSSRYRQALANERELADELAHELRTPLASIALTARTLQHSLQASARLEPHADQQLQQQQQQQTQLLQQLEQSTRVAGQVMADLLALARTSRTALAEARQPVDVSELARCELARCAQTALNSGHELALHSPGPLVLSGHPLLLALALRNLLENAFSHTPAGTLVSVWVDPAARWIQVCDEPLQHAGSARAAAPATSLASPALGLKIGHRVVTKVAEVHGAQFGCIPTPGQSSAHCYRLTFPANNTPTQAA